MSLCANSPGRWPGYWVTMLTISALLIVGASSLLTLSGCSTSPPTRADGLPIVPRYTNAIQLDWMLTGYREAADRATQNGQAAPVSPSDSTLLEDACLGWERAIFDLESGRRYPAYFRMSTDNANLTNLLARYPEIIRRHRHPAACDAVEKQAPASARPAPIATSAAGQVPAFPQPVAATNDQPPQTGDQTGDQASAPMSSLAPTNDTQAQPQVSVAPAPIAPALPANAPRHASAVANERILLSRLRAALHISSDPAVAESGPASPIDIATLQELSQSDLPTIRLRARYHLLGQCVLATERGDHDWLVAGSAIGESAGCVDRGPREPMRLVQKRLSRSMLEAWRGRTFEPFSDLAVALASFALRDNPNLDGPRIAR